MCIAVLCDKSNILYIQAGYCEVPVDGEKATREETKMYFLEQTPGNNAESQHSMSLFGCPETPGVPDVFFLPAIAPAASSCNGPSLPSSSANFNLVWA